MSATLIAVVIALVLGHVAPALARLRRYDWYAAWARWLHARAPDAGLWRSAWSIALLLLPPLLLLGALQWVLDGGLLGLLGLLLGIVVLFYAWGPRDLDVDVEAIVEADSPAERQQAIARLWPEQAAVATDAPALVGAVFENALRRWFGVLFWFLLLGPVGALGYRLAAVSAEGGLAGGLPAGTRHGARGLLAVLDWPVAQLMTLALALVGSFDSVLGAWKAHGGASFGPGHDFLGAAARASVRSELADEAMDYAEEGMDDAEEGVPASSALVQQLGELPELRDAMSLVWRSLLLWLAILAMFVIAGWVH